MAYRAENRYGCQNGLAQRPDDFTENHHMGRAVNLRALFQLCRNGLNIGFYQNNIVRGNDSGNDVGPEGIRQAQHLHI